MKLLKPLWARFVASVVGMVVVIGAIIITQTIRSRSHNSEYYITENDGNATKKIVFCQRQMQNDLQKRTTTPTSTILVKYVCQKINGGKKYGIV